MGFIRHDAIIVTSDNAERISEVRAVALSRGLPCSELVKSTCNGYRSFVIAPDGSKEGWSESRNGDIARADWIEHVSGSDGIRVDWAYVRFGGDQPEMATLVDHNCPEDEDGMPHDDYTPASPTCSHGDHNEALLVVLKRVAEAITTNLSGVKDQSGIFVSSLTEAVMAMTAAINRVADNMSDALSSIRRR